MENICHVIVIFESGRVRHWQDTVTAVADVYSVNRHALGNAVTALQYEALAGDLPEQERPSHRMLIRALCAASGAEAAVAEEWLGLLCEAVRGAAEPEDIRVAPV